MFKDYRYTLAAAIVFFFCALFDLIIQERGQSQLWEGWWYRLTLIGKSCIVIMVVLFLYSITLAFIKFKK